MTRDAAARRLLPLDASAGAASETDALPIIELRQYTLKPGKTEVLIELFDREFIESQDAAGMKVLGQFRDLDRTDRFVWIRGFADMASRANGLNAFYSGPIWRAHRDAANATMVDSGNVLLLHTARPGASFVLDGRVRPPTGTSQIPPGLVVATIYYFDRPAGSPFVDVFETVVRPQLNAAGTAVLASYVTETSPNSFPRLPVRENEHVFVWFASFTGEADYERHLAVLAKSPTWSRVAAALRRKLNAPPELLRLQPTPRSMLR